ncbi:MAG: extracellular solute-binding protein [Actinomycetota bacterium]|nr:extracellular solute-binding protein [Actinomycetota bacterium]
MRAWVAFAVGAAAVALGACGGDASGGSTTLNYYIFNEPGGGPQKVAEECAKQSGGRYEIEFQYLPARADQQREQLVRRLGAEDKSIDLIGMDIIWTGEFANAGWLAEVPQEYEGRLTENVFDSVLETAKFEDKLYNVPAWSNTQLLWYRKDKVDQPPETWDEMIDTAVEEKGKIEVQANRYEGLVVWTNAMILSAGAKFLEGPQEVAMEEEGTKRALEVMGKLGRSPAAATAIDTSNEDSARLGFEAGTSIFMINYPFVFPSAKENAPDVFENMGAAKFPKVDAAEESRPPLGGINIGVSEFSRKQDLAWEAIECMVKPENQITIAEMGGLPPVREDVYDSAEVQKIYPGFADVIRESIASAGPRPSESPAYQDLSLGIQRGVHPVTKITSPDAAYDRLRDYVEQAVKREGLL